MLLDFVSNFIENTHHCVFILPNAFDQCDVKVLDFLSRVQAATDLDGSIFRQEIVEAWPLADYGGVLVMKEDPQITGHR